MRSFNFLNYCLANIDLKVSMEIGLLPIVIILPLSSLISRVIYIRTKKLYIGGIIMGDNCLRSYGYQHFYRLK